MQVRHRFDSWGEFVERAVNGTTELEDWQRSSRGGRPGFHGVKSWEEALDLAHNGWSERRAEILDITDKIKHDLAPTLVTTFASTFDVAGGSVDIGRFMSGEPENMVNLHPVKIAKPGRVITIVVATGYTSEVRPEDVIERGAAIVALIELLELLQHSTEVWAEYACKGTKFRNEKSTWSAIVKVKGADEKLDIDKLSFTLGHPASHRSIGFSVKECEPVKVQRHFGFSRSGGYSQSTKPVQAETVGATLVLPDLKMRTPAEEWVRKHLCEFGLLAETC